MERPRIPAAEEFRFRVRLRTRWCDEDNQRVLNNAVYLTLFEEARLAYFSKLGFVRAEPVPVPAGADQRASSSRRARAASRSSSRRARASSARTSFTQCYRVLEAASGTLWAEAEARLVLYDPATGAKRPMEPEFRRAIESLEGLR